MTAATDPTQLLAEGRLAEAEALCEQNLAAAPDDIPSLTIAGLGALRRADVPRALALLERAAGLAKDDGVVLHYLARAREAGGDEAGARACDEAAVRAAPDHGVARLYYARSLERAGDVTGAALQYARTLKEAQAAGRWADAQSTPVPLRTLVEQAVLVVRRERGAALERLLLPIVSRYGRSSVERVQAAIRIYLGGQSPTYPDPRQRPTFFYIPGLPPSAYFDRRLFSWIPGYEAAYAGIRRELQALLPSAGGRERVFDSEELEHANLRGAAEPPTWNGYYFYRHGERREDNCTACPITVSALDAISLMRVRDHGPEVLYSVFTAGTHLLPHRGVTNARAVSHLPLIVPPDCALSVGGEVHAWREGRAVVFDDTYEHEAWNRADSLRVVLIADVWNPHLTEAERAAVTDVIAAIGDLGGAVQRA